jgi:DNA-binding transcriptional ArsR family regulator
MASTSSTDRVFAALSDRTRRDVLERIGAAGEASATQLARDLPISRQAIAKHLTSLSAAGLIADRRSGREVLYRVTPAPMSGAMSWMATVGAQWDDRLASLRRHLGG